MQAKQTLRCRPCGALLRAFDPLEGMACHERAGLGQRVEWRWWEPIRTISEVPLEFTIPITKTFLFQSLSDLARGLREKGLSYLAISKILKIDDKTVKKAITKGKNLLSFIF